MCYYVLMIKHTTKKFSYAWSILALIVGVLLTWAAGQVFLPLSVVVIVITIAVVVKLALMAKK